LIIFFLFFLFLFLSFFLLFRLDEPPGGTAEAQRREVREGRWHPAISVRGAYAVLARCFSDGRSRSGTLSSLSAPGTPSFI
jgi:hypothetical protein